jgi:hypothetical protein
VSSEPLGDMSNRELVERLRVLTPKELTEVVLEATATTDPTGDNSRLVLAVADKSTHELWVVCSTDESWVSDAPLCQSSEHSGVATISWAKDSTCPICGVHVRGT